MFRFTCPHCGERDVVEFSYGGDASVAVPDLTVGQDAWFDAVYQRDNPRGPHVEYWHHVAGCRQWMRVERNTLTHEILACGPAAGPMPDETGSDEAGGEGA